MTLKLADELCVMTIKNNAIRNLTNFDSNTRKSKKIAL